MTSVSLALRKAFLASPTVVMLWRSFATKRRALGKAAGVALSPIVNPLLLMALLQALPMALLAVPSLGVLGVSLGESLGASLGDSLGHSQGALASLGALLGNTTSATSSTSFPDQVAILGRIVMSAYLVLGFSAHSQAALIEMVVEKEKKIKEGLLMQGLSPTAFWFSVHLTYAAFAATVCALITFIISPLFPLSNLIPIFMLLFFLDLANITSTLALAPFFNTSKAALLFDSFISVLLFTIPIILIFWLEWAPSEIAIIFLSLVFYPLGFFFGMLRVNQLEMEGVGCNWENSLDGRGIGGFLIVLGVDCVLYMLIALYLDQVVPQEFGVPRPWWFPLRYLHRKTYDKWVHASHQESTGIDESAPNASTDDIESDPLNMKMLVNLVNLSMKYPKADANAVDGFGVKLFEDEIFALLGPNGAGKSTVLHILTGLVSPTSGHGTIAGYDLINEMTSVRQLIGVCPQHDIQHDDLTVREHVLLFAGIKGLWATQSQQDLEDMVTKVLTQLDLQSKRDEFAKTLSGGQKRKLSVAMAIVGDPKILILDEPTAGMDPVSRRSVWGMLAKHKKGRLTFLATHMMDEADLVADRKAILSKGRVRCLGTSVFLKHRFHIGYQLSVAFPLTQSNDLKITSLVSKYIPSSSTLSASPMRQQPPRSPAIGQTRASPVAAGSAENTLVFSIPPDAVSHFPRLFNALDKQVKSGGVLFYGLSMPSLEEVFLKSDGGGVETSEEARLAEEYWTRESAHDVVDEEALLLGNENVLHSVPVFAQLISIVHARWIMLGRSLSSTIPGILFPLYMFYPIFTSDISSATSSFWLITMSLYFSGVSWARETVQERFSRMDAFLKSMGVSPMLYWLSTVVSHFPVMAAPGLVVCWLVTVWNVEAFGGPGFWMFLSANVVFSVLCLVSTYLLGLAFTEPGAFLTTASLLITFGTALPYSSLMYFDTMGDPFLSKITHTLLSFLVPTYPFSAILYHMAMASAKADAHRIPTLTPGYYFRWENAMLPSLVGMLFQCVVGLLLVVYFDGGFLQPMRTVLSAEEVAVPVDLGADTDDPVQVEDANVSREREKVVDPLCAEELLLRRVRKVFKEVGDKEVGVLMGWVGWVLMKMNGRRKEIRDLVAVREVSLGVRRGEVVAILGPNGAGKTTVMSMAVGDLVPTRGVVAISTLAGQYPPQSVLARASLFGQVAQHDTLWPLLTAREHLNLFASLKGIVQNRRTFWIRMLVDAMGSNLSADLDKQCKEMSGGTKRKIAFLVSLVGKPQILFLDEPSTGIDPKAKRNLWNLVKALQGRLATVLTTHSMDEADALASRIGIMVNGGLACLGTQQYIKSNYGKGYLLEVHTQSGDGTSAEVTRVVERNFPRAVLKEQFDEVMARWEVPEEDVANLGGLGKVFEMFEGVKVGTPGLKEFCFGQMSLEMVFLKFAKREEGIELDV
ncbi:ATP-binding cassette sub- A member 5 [Podochytrium sp. JEL0797]|nr:ATP-binding cassette sub- A member 5 [Podochytrium sp. JEL0797]